MGLLRCRRPALACWLTWNTTAVAVLITMIVAATVNNVTANNNSSLSNNSNNSSSSSNNDSNNSSSSNNDSNNNNNSNNSSNNNNYNSGSSRNNDSNNNNSNNDTQHSLCISSKAQAQLGDRILAHVRRHLLHGEPFTVRPASKGMFRFYNGKLFGLHQFTSRQPPQVGCSDDPGPQVHVNLLLSFNLTRMHYNWKVGEIRQFSGGMWTFTQRVTVDLSLVTPLHGRQPLRVTSMRMTEMHEPWVRIDGVQPFAWIASQIGSLSTYFGRTAMKEFMQTNYRHIFDEAFKRCYI